MENTLPPDILWKMINGMSAIITFMFISGVSIFVFFHKQILRRLDTIDMDLKPINTKVELHSQRLEDVVKRLDEHGKRISELEKKK
jgi:hypothetical protein